MNHIFNLSNIYKISHLLLIFGIFIGVTSFISLKYSLIILSIPVLVLLFSFLVIKPWIGLLIYVFIIPLKRMVYFSDSFFLAVPKIIGLIVFLTWLFNLIIYKKKKFLNISHNYIILLFILIIFISGFSATYIPDFFIELIRYFMAFGLFFIICNTIKSKKQLNTLIWILVIAVSISALIGIIQHFTGMIFGNFSMISTWILNQNREFGGTLHPNNLASFTVIVIPFIFLLSTNHIVNKNRKILLFIIFINIIGLILTKSRSGFLGFIIIWFLIFLISKYKKQIIFLSLLITICILFISPNYFDRISTLKKINLENHNLIDSSIMSRYYIQKTGFYTFLDYPIIGIGLGNFKNFVYQKYRLISKPLVAHNYYLNIVTEIGMIGLFLFTILLYYSCKNYKKINNYIMISFILIIFLLLFSNIMEYYNFWLLLSLIIISKIR